MSKLDLTTEKNVEENGKSVDLSLELRDFINILHDLIREPSVVGCEDAFFRSLKRELEEVGVNVQYYQGILVAQEKKPKVWFYQLILIVTDFYVQELMNFSMQHLSPVTKAN